MATKDKEIWKPITFIKGTSVKKYAVSSHGRLASYDKNIDERFVLKLHKNGGFPMSTIHVNGKSKALFVHKALGETFLKKPSQKHNFVLHLDYKKDNNDLSNLKWATKEEQVEHSKKSPYVLAAAAHKVYSGATARKLDEKKVIQLKKEIWNPKRKQTLKQIAAKYGIAEMNLYRIKNGELWFHVHVEGEPVFPKYKEQLKNIDFHNKLVAKEKVEIQKRKVEKIAAQKVKAEKLKKREAEKKVKLEQLAKNKKLKATKQLNAAKKIAEKSKKEKQKKGEVKKKVLDSKKKESSKPKNKKEKKGKKDKKKNKK